RLVGPAPRLVPLRAGKVEPAERDDARVLRLGDPACLPERCRALPGRRGRRVETLLPEDLLREEVWVAAEQDVGAAARHVGRDRDGALAAGLGDDLGLALVVLGVQDLVADPALLGELRQLLGLLARDRAVEA